MKQPPPATRRSAGRPAGEGAGKGTGHGGRRPGAGRKRGGKNTATIAKKQARELARRIITTDLEALVRAQIQNALGVSYLVTRDKTTGKFLRVIEDRSEPTRPNEEVLRVWEKDPSVQAFTDLMNRALDLPAKQAQQVNVYGSIDLVARLKAARRRLAKHGRPAPSTDQAAPEDG